MKRKGQVTFCGWVGAGPCCWGVGTGSGLVSDGPPKNPPPSPTRGGPSSLTTASNHSPPPTRILGRAKTATRCHGTHRPLAAFRDQSRVNSGSPCRPSRDREPDKQTAVGRVEPLFGTGRAVGPDAMGKKQAAGHTFSTRGALDHSKFPGETIEKRAPVVAVDSNKWEFQKGPPLKKHVKHVVRGGTRDQTLRLGGARGALGQCGGKSDRLCGKNNVYPHTPTPPACSVRTRPQKTKTPSRTVAP